MICVHSTIRGLSGKYHSGQLFSLFGQIKKTCFRSFLTFYVQKADILGSFGQQNGKIGTIISPYHLAIRSPCPPPVPPQHIFQLLTSLTLPGQDSGQSFPAVFYAGFLKSVEIQSVKESVDSFLRTVKIIVFQKLPDILPHPGNLSKYFFVLHHKLRFAVFYLDSLPFRSFCFLRKWMSQSRFTHHSHEQHFPSDAYPVLALLSVIKRPGLLDLFKSVHIPKSFCRSVRYPHSL